MRKNELYRIAEHFSAYEVRFSDDGDSLQIINPFGKDAILVECDGEAYIVCVTAHFHIHLEPVEQVVAYVRNILEGKRVIIEFYKDGNWSMSADLKSQELRELSYTSLSQRMHMVRDGKVVPYGDLLIEAADSFHVRGWAQDVDFDAVFVRDGQGNVTIQTCDA